METAHASETGCCPRFDPEPWDEQEVVFEDKLFLKDRVRCLFHIPLNFGAVMKRCMTKIDAANACDPQQLVLSDACSPWHADVYIALDKEVPSAENVRLSGTYLAKVFEGPYGQVGKWMKQFRDWVTARGKTLKRTVFYYTTCPKCAKAYGKNYVVLLGEV